MGEREHSLISSVYMVFSAKNNSKILLMRRNACCPLPTSAERMDKIRKILRNKQFQIGAPFIIMVVGGSFGLKIYSELRYDIQKERHIMTKTKELRKIIGATKERTLEEEYEEYKRTVNLEDWKNIRGPRPWETDNTEYKELIEKRAKESKDQWVFKKG